MANLGQLKRDISRYKRVSGDVIRLGNRSKWVEGSLFAIIDLLLGAEFIISYFMTCGGMIFTKNLKFKKNSFHFIFNLFFHVITAP